MPELVPVRVRDCACPHTPHDDGDVVFIRPTLSLVGGIAAQQDLGASGGETGELIRRWLVTFVRYGAVDWNFLDESGAAVPFSLDVLLDDFSLASPVAEQADELYSEAVLRPLGLSRPKSSPSGPTADSTSHTPRSRSRSRASS